MEIADGETADDAGGREKANHIYLMPFPRGEYDIYVVPVPEEGEKEQKLSELEEKVREMGRSKKILERILAGAVEDFIVESSLVKAVHNDYPILVHHPEGMHPLDAFVRYEDVLTRLQKKNRVEFLTTVGGGVLSMFFGEWFFPLMLGPYAAKRWRRERAYELLLELGDEVICWEEESTTPPDGAKLWFESDGRLKRISDYLTLSDGRVRRYKNLIKFCKQNVELEEFGEFYLSRLEE